ncbi:MAG: Ig-like domain-containing protein, partial [Clostridia bacterium]|nr:Ig-like domain-containing protein [Clostridia bacterium]
NADGSFTATVSVKVANENPGITLDKTEIELTEGEDLTVEAQFVPKYPGDATTLAWASDDETVAIVENGKIIAISAGDCVITVKNADGSYTANVSVTVLSKKVANENPGITLDKTEVELKVDESIFVDAVFVPEYQGDNTALLWISDAEGIATVENGMIKAEGVGSCSVVVVNADGKYRVTITVTVTEAEVEKVPNENPGITLDKEEVTLTLPGSDTVSAQFVPAFVGDDETLYWFSDNEEVATVEGGVITAVGQGSCTVTVKNGDESFSKTVTVTVSASQTVDPGNEEEILPPSGEGGEDVLPPDEGEEELPPPDEDDEDLPPENEEELV